MAQILASTDDINVHLPNDKITADDNNTGLWQVEAARYVRSMLAGTFKATTLVGWDTPSHTPDIVRSVAGRLIASKFYAERYAEDADTSSYATQLYNEANRILNGIKTGTVLIIDTNDNPIEISGLAISTDDFYPNDSAPPPKFTMDRVSG